MCCGGGLSGAALFKKKDIYNEKNIYAINP